jgi:starch-binding outer membrane protein, SusD/RagB family
MKRIQLFFFALIVILSISGCTKKLEKDPPDQFSDDNFWTSENNVRTYNWGFYELFTGFGTGTTADFYFSTFTDDQAATGFQNFAVSAAATNSAWDWSFIRKANIMLERMDRVPMSDEAKNHWKGIARFFRALDYFNKVKTFGDVPWVSRSLDVGDVELIYKPRDPRKLVMDSVLADLNYAIANLRVADQANTVNRDVALALKSRVGLYEGTYRKYHTELALPDADKFLLASKDASEKLMTGTYLLGDYKALYSSMDLTGNKEVLLFRKYVAGAQTHSVIGYTNSSTQMSGLTKSAVESYATTDGLPITLSPLYQGDANIQQVRANRDKRLLVTIDTFLAYNGTLVGGLSSSTGYRPSKFLQPLSAQLAPNNETDAPLFWLAEILLNYAEASAELDHMGKYTFTQADLDKSINLLRARGGIAKLQTTGSQNVAINGVAFIDPKKDADVTPLIWEIRRERRVELMMDGFRYTDLMRWKKGNYMDTDKNPDAILGAKVPDNGKVLRNAQGYIMPYSAVTKRTFIDPKHYLSAIPTGQISLYPKDVLAQNPGW